MTRLLCRLLLVVTMASAAHQASASHVPVKSIWNDQYLAQYDRRSGGRISMGAAMDMVQRQTGGRVLNAQEVRNGYRIKVLTRSGEVRVFFVDAQTGAMQQD